MTPHEALHAAARRCCSERIDLWREQYARLAPFDPRHGYSDAQEAVFPRYNVLEAILVEVERLRPEELADLPDARERLCGVGQTAQSVFTEGPHGPIEQRVIQEQRDLFCSFVDGLDAASLAEVAPLPYRRTLGEEERRALWARVERSFKFGDEPYLHPLYPLQGGGPSDVMTFEGEAFRGHVPPGALQGILSQAGVRRLWELREFGPDREIDLCLLVPVYDACGEGYWTSQALDWLIHASHEHRVTVSGAWLLARLHESWPGCAAHRQSNFPTRSGS